MMKQFKYLLFFVLIWLSADSYGQYFKKLGMKDGLSNPSVLAVYQDTLGRMWFGTNEGINVYDGNQIYKYKSYYVVDEQHRKRKFINGMVNQIVGDSLGNIFLRNNGLLIKYDIYKETFKEISSRWIGALGATKGKVWCAIRDSLFYIDSKTDALNFCRKLNTAYIRCMEVVDGKLWIGTAEGLYVVDDHSMKCVLPRIEIFKLFLSSRKELWIASRMDGLYKVGRDGVLRKETNAPDRVVSNQIRDFVEDDRQNIWFGTFEGLQVYNPYSDTYQVYRPGYHPGSLEHQSVFSLCKDRQGTIWVGTYYGGVNYFNYSRSPFTYYPYDKSNNHCLNFPLVGQMIEDKEHNLWIGTEGGGVNCLNRESGTFTYYTSSDNNSVLYNNIKTMAYDKARDQLYIGTYTGGLSRYDRKSKQFHHYLTAFQQTGKGPDQIINQVLFKDGWLYVVARNGFWRFNPEKEEFQLLTKEALFLSFEIDSQGYIWLVESSILYRMKIDDWDHLEQIDFDGSSKSNARITRIMEAADGTVYVSTLGDGVFSYSYDTRKWKQYTEEQNHLLSNFCYNLAETPMNNILVTSDEGVSIYSPFNRSTHSIELGLNGGISAVSAECGIYVAEDDLIYIGGIDGLISFREKDLYKESKSTPEMYFSHLYINNAQVAPNDESGVLTAALPFMKQLGLSYNQNNLIVEFSSSNYVEQEKRNEYQYKLEGFDKEWITTDQLRVSYTNLSPGDYVLKVRKLGNKSEGEYVKEISIDIIIHHPWYATIWAYLFYCILLAGIIYSLWRVRMARNIMALSLAKEKNEKEQMEEVNKMKLRFFTNISHEFRTPLTLIIGQIEMLLQLEKLSPILNKRLQGVYRNAMNLRLLITELLDFRKQEQGFMKLKVERTDIVPFVKEIYQQFTDLARRRKITYTFEFAEEKTDVWFDPVQMQKAVFNLLSNAFKYTPEGGTIKVSIRKQQRMVEVTVKDSGCGIPQEFISKIFERFYQVDELSQKGSLGSGIGLALTKGIVDAHKGTIEVDSTLGEGSRFSMQLPLGNGHFTAEELEHEKIIMPLSDWGGFTVGSDFVFSEVAEKAEAETAEEKAGMPVILLVDDDEDILEMLVGIFSPTYVVHKATNGQMGYEMAQQLQPDIIVSDVMMPVMSGKDMCYKIKNNLELAYIPVVLLTAQASEDYTIEGYMFGADDYITKPFNVKLLLARCGNLLRNRQTLLKRIVRTEKIKTQETGGLSVADQKLLDTATEIIKRNFENSNFDMDQLAAELGLGRSKMFIRLKEVVGLTPNEFTLKLKLEEALRMLQEESQYNIAEISYNLGFTSPRYFSRCFKTFYGVSPQSYRKDPARE